ncbi:MAG: DUF2141 domain-containing protein [Bacteroidales bacterium]|nr:DUF2141 domain-containing protein [Bacteroidales bacterium]MCF8404022.1 DUF2141 domain-containing protein [Bacteroidales bacterium]
MQIQINIKRTLLPVYLLFFFLNIIAQNDSSTVIVVKVIGLRNDNGSVGITLFNSAEGFPMDFNKAIRKKYIEIKNNTVETTFKDVPEGAYAIAVYHDEDNDRKMDTNFLGIPKEGTGSSNNPKPRMGPPVYTNCQFETKNSTSLIIIMKYLL